MTREEFEQLLTSAMLGAGGDAPAANVKTRVIEAHPDELSPDGCDHLIERHLATEAVYPTKVGDSLWRFAVKGRDMFLDTVNPRYWLLHTSAPADLTSRFVKTSFYNRVNFDSAWLPAVQMESLPGDQLWFKSSFQSEVGAKSPDRASTPNRWRLQVEGAAPDEFLDFIRSDSRFVSNAAVTAVGSVMRDEAGQSSIVAADYLGAFVSRGSSFELASSVIWQCVDRYEAYVREIEARNRVTIDVVDGALEVDGDVAYIDFLEPVDDIESLLAHLFSCREPFRLWGSPREVAPMQWETNAVDLHVANALTIEVTPRWLRVVLNDHACGNTLARLVANLQHRVDARLSVPAAA